MAVEIDGSIVEWKFRKYGWFDDLRLVYVSAISPSLDTSDTLNSCRWQNFPIDDLGKVKSTLDIQDGISASDTHPEMVGSLLALEGRQCNQEHAVIL